MKKYCYDFPRPGLTVDAVIYSFFDSRLHILLIERGIEPYLGCWALPGGFVNEDENVYQAVRREIEEETSLKINSLEPFYFASEPGRDPRGWTVSSVFIGYIADSHNKALAGDDARNLKWFPINELPDIAFDHTQIIGKSRKFLYDSVRNKVINRNIFHDEFSITDLSAVYVEIGYSVKETEILINHLIGYKVIIKNTGNMYFFSKTEYAKIEQNGFPI